MQKVVGIDRGKAKAELHVGYELVKMVVQVVLIRPLKLRRRALVLILFLVDALLRGQHQVRGQDLE